jgi:hypothetical protein
MESEGLARKGALQPEQVAGKGLQKLGSAFCTNSRITRSRKEGGAMDK